MSLRDLLVARLSDPRDRRRVALYAASGITVLLFVAAGWSGVTSGGSENAGFHVMCAAADCGCHFLVPREKAQTYPRGPAGQGLKCKRCGRFAGQMAAECPKCRQWFIPHSTETGPRCPKCAGPPPPTRRPTSRR